MQARIEELQRQQRPPTEPQPGTSSGASAGAPLNLTIEAVTGASGSGIRAQAAVAPQQRLARQVRQRPLYPRILGLPPHDPNTLSHSHPGYIVETAPGAIRIMEAQTVVSSEPLLRALREFTSQVEGKSQQFYEKSKTILHPP